MPAASLAPTGAVTSSSARGAALYLGNDWLMYIDRAASYSFTEAVAPCVMLSEPGRQFPIRLADQTAFQAAASLHAMHSFSSAAEAGIGAAFLYFDPASAAAQGVRRLCADAGQRPWQDDCVSSLAPAWFESMADGAAAPADMACWVGTIRSALAAHAGPCGVDPRLRTVAGRLSVNVAGRLDLAALARHVHWSPEHLRKEFRQGVGTTLSHYLMWCRLLCLMGEVCAGTRVERRHGGRDLDGALQGAGFYDTPHGNRVLQRFFGISAGSALADSIRFVDCCAALAGPSLAACA